MKPAAAVVVLCAATELLAAPQAPQLPELLQRTSAYVAGYRMKASGVALEEQFMLIEETQSRMVVPRRIASDLVLVNISDRLMGVRDPYAIDTVPVRERQPRITTTLVESGVGGWERVQGFARENVHLLLHNVVLWYSDPMLALQFVEARNHERMTFKIDGRKKAGNVQLTAIGFKEIQGQGKTYLLDTPENPSSSGRIWVDATTGAVHQTELWLQSSADTGRSHVIYALDPATSLIVPSQATHSLEWRQRGSGVSNMGAGGQGIRMAFSANVKYGNVRYTPINLSRFVR